VADVARLRIFEVMPASDETYAAIWEAHSLSLLKKAEQALEDTATEKQKCTPTRPAFSARGHHARRRQNLTISPAFSACQEHKWPGLAQV